MIQEPFLFTTRQTAELLQIGHKAVLKLIDGGELRAIRISNKWMVPRSEVLVWIDLRAAVDSVEHEHPTSAHPR